jgi:hypothetical protein
MPSIKNNLTTIMKPAIDNLINEELKDNDSNEDLINPKLI